MIQFKVDFFFQAEDGIRDGHVTGVQTCALPILTISPSDRLIRGSVVRSFAHFVRSLPHSLPYMYNDRSERSEERRVGKECSARWSRERKKKINSEKSNEKWRKKKLKWQEECL